MKLFGASIWNTVQAEVRSVGSVLGNLDIPRKLGARSEGIAYQLKPDLVRTFAMSGLPFLTFYEFNDMAGWYRDVHFAPDHVAGYKEDIGKSYTVWTKSATSEYRRHIFLDELKSEVTMSFAIPSLDTASWFPLRIQLFDRDGLYFQHDQKLVVERMSEGRSTLTSWKKVPQLQACLPRLHQQTRNAALA